LEQKIVGSNPRQGVKFTQYSVVVCDWICSVAVCDWICVVVNLRK
jgi:hypothetical protein